MARCRYGKLKNPIGRRKCKKRSPIGRKRARRGALARVYGRSGSKVCRFGKLKNPTGKRVCRKRPGSRRRRVSRAAQEAAMWRAYRAGR